jgi:AraC family transcriptional regulator
MRAHFHEDISLVEIASAAGMSPSALTLCFRRETMLTPYAFVIALRLRQATVMLQTTDMPLARVAVAAGFADQPHMTRVFRAKRGITPGAIRRGG